MELIEGIKKRRTIRKFNDKEISVDTIKEIVNISQYAPSWKNTQTVRYNLICDKSLIKTIAEGVGSDWNKGIILGANKVMIITTVNNISGFERDGSPSTSKGTHWQSFDAGVFAYNFTLTAFSYGIGSVIMGIYNEAKIKEILNLPNTESVSCIIPIGYFDELPNAPKKKTSDDILRIK